MGLCFGAIIQTLRYCTKPKVTNKVLCGAIIKSINESYGCDIECDDGTVGHLIKCDHNLSPENVVEPARTADLSSVSRGMSKYLLPLLDDAKIKVGILTLKAIAISDDIEPDVQIGRMKCSSLQTMSTFNPADFFGDVFIYTATSVANKSGKALWA